MISKMSMIADSAERLRLPRMVLRSPRLNGRICSTPAQSGHPVEMIRPYNELQPESKRAFERGFEELTHRANMKTGGITAFDKRDFGLDLPQCARFTHRTKEFFDAQSNVQLEVLDALIDYTAHGP